MILIFVFWGRPVAAETPKDAEPAHGGTGIESVQVLDLKAAQRMALADNPSLAAAMDRVVQARERVAQAAAAYWPSLDLNGTGARLWPSDREKQMLMAPDDTERVFSADATAAYVLFNGFARKFQNLSAVYGQQESESARMDGQRLILSAVAAAYYNAQLERANIAIAEADESFNQRLTQDAQARYDVGAGPLSDVLNFQVQVNSARTQLLLARQQHKAAMYGLAALLGIPNAAFPEGMELAPFEHEKSEEFILPESEPLIAYAHAHRPDILRAEYQSKQADAGIGLARAGRFPTIALSGAVEGERTDNPWMESDDIGGSLVMNFNFNLFDAGRTQAKIREAQARKSESENAMKDLRITVTAEVLKAVEALKLTQDQVKLQRSNQDLVQKNRDLVEKEYKAGEASLVRLNEAQRDLTKAQSRLALALVSLRQAWENLKAATAEILEPFRE
jgi:outer membrane protein TolC